MCAFNRMKANLIPNDESTLGLISCISATVAKQADRMVTSHRLLSFPSRVVKFYQSEKVFLSKVLLKYLVKYLQVWSLMPSYYTFSFKS